MPRRHPLLSGKSRTRTVYIPDALWEELERQRADGDEHDKVSPFIVDLLFKAARAEYEEWHREATSDAVDAKK